ncbi:nitroreductase family deazaflavin-dependent oxidoreductase [Microbacterium sp. X-17]|uniref:nitroreductase family deazaflavin-dependent oxidoreductase n=1 Tax=Microbacterium sp. X-17 TaxID=3144404 RepID=UPI0031F5CFA8
MSDGDYAPSPREYIARQVADYERTGGVEGGITVGAPCIILTSRGARSGKVRKTPLVRVTDGRSYVVIGSHAGAPTDPAWVHNLRADADCRLQDGAVLLDYRARETEGADRASWWALATSVWPAFDDYQAKAGRLIPLFVLEPKA